MMLLLSPTPILAQTEGTEEATQAVQPTQVQENPAPSPTTPTDTPSEIDGILVIIGSVALVIMLGGSLALAFRGLDAAKVSVPQDTVNNITLQIVNVMKTTMEEIGKQVQASPSPVDDAIWAAGRIPVDVLIQELSKRTMTPADSQRAYEAIQRTLDDTVTGMTDPKVSPFLDE